MKINILLLAALVVLFASCATICGGSKYNATVIVKDRTDALISYQGLQRGNGTATFLVRRKEADKFAFSVKVADCKEQQFFYRSRTFRGWAFVGTIVGWTGYIGGYYIPWGVFTDLGTGALWKPNVNEQGVIKLDYKNFAYPVTYTGCPTDQSK